MHNKGNLNKVKRQPSEWEKIIANETTDKKVNLQAAHAGQYQKNKYQSKSGPKK